MKFRKCFRKESAVQENGRVKTQYVFRRVESKFLITREQYDELMQRAAPYLCDDRYKEGTITSLYYDTPSHLLIRRSLEKPLYKEKIRLRAYGEVGQDDRVFAEIKVKHNGVVYKRRVAMTLGQALAYLAGEAPPPVQTQITRELDWRKKLYEREGGLAPAMTVVYDRRSYRGVDPEEDLRVTFDTGVRFRCDRLSPEEGLDGRVILPPDGVLMEVKTSRALPLWLVRILSEMGIYKSSFSKYGTAYLVSQGLIPCATAQEKDKV